jgi:hypothetical protein
MGPPEFFPPESLLPRRVIYGAAIGLLVGWAQAQALPKFAGSVLLWGLVGALGGVALTLAGDVNAIDRIFPVGGLNGALAGAAYGTVTGLPLALYVLTARASDQHRAADSTGGVAVPSPIDIAADR